jgi:Do/DeqQ family serine protease
MLLMVLAWTGSAMGQDQSPNAAQSAIADAQRLGAAFSSVAERVSPSVVSIVVDTPVPDSPFPLLPFGPAPNDRFDRGNGSGVILRADGFILTNRHVIQNAVRIQVTLRDGRRFNGTVVGTDMATDLAVIRIDARNLPTATFAEMSGVRVGDWVVAIGSPFGLDYSVTVGVVSALGRALEQNEIEDFVQTDASINPGNSGGPMVNLEGQVVGINTMIVGRGTGIGFAVAGDLAHRVADSLIRHGRVRRAWIGVGFQELTPDLASEFGLGESRGALVSSVVPSGPAQRAGLAPGDVVVEVDGTAIRAGRDLLRQVLQKPVGARVQLAVMREGRRRAITVRTAERPARNEEAPAATPASTRTRTPALGLQMETLGQSSRIQTSTAPGGQGVLVTAVEPGSQAFVADLRPGDVIVEADRRPAREPSNVLQALQDGRVLLLVQRNGSSMFTILTRR